jgi:glycosyltransferase involved in cell wall biosynthesis
MSPSETKTGSQDPAKIMILVYSLAQGGAERMSVELAHAWAERGYSVTMVTLAPVEIDFFRLDPQIKRVSLSFPADPGGALLKRIHSNLARLRAIRRVLREERPEVVLGMTNLTAVLLAMASIGLRMRTYGSERTYPPMVPLGAARERMRWFTYGFLTGVIGQTEAAGRWLRENTRARQVHVIPNHVDLPLRARAPIIMPSEVLGEDRRCVLAVGRLAEEKQFPRLIDAFVALAPRFPQWDLVIAGDGLDRPELLARIAAKGLESRVHLPGAAGNIADWYGRADIFAMTSRFEGFPNALLEAMAYGTPPIAFDCMTGPSELIRNGQNGLLIPLNDMVGLVEGLAKLMEDEPLRVELGRRASSAREDFDTERVTNLWLETFGLVEGAKHG